MKPEYSKELLAEMWKKLNLAREFETRVQWLFSMGLVHGTTHLGIGEEATAVGSILALKPQDYVFGTHRGHSQAIAKGIDIDRMMAEILAKETGVCKGKGGSMHIASPDINYFATSGILGASSVIANGAALTIKKRNERDRITAVFYGDGASNEGACFEALNLAALWKLPILFVCINNTYGMSTPIAKAMHDTDLSKRAYPFGIPSKTVDGNHVLEVYDAVSEAREYVLENGPMMVVENTYRIFRPLQERRQPVPFQGGNQRLEGKMSHQGVPELPGGAPAFHRGGAGRGGKGGRRRHRPRGGIRQGQ